MMKSFFRTLAVAAAVVVSSGAMAQQGVDKAKSNDNEEIVIIKKGDKDTKITVEINNGEVKVNGKPLSDFNDDNVVVSKRRVAPGSRVFVAPRSPFRGGTYYDDPAMKYNDATMNLKLAMNINRALLGVITEKTENGVKVTSVTKGSAAEKAGLKEDDVITKVDETSISSPEDLTKAIGKFKPEDKTVITYKRDKKEQKANVSLGKREGATTLFNNDDPLKYFNEDALKNFRYDFNGPKVEGFGMARAGTPRLGIKAQDTEEGKGVKVLDVDEASNAEKAGMKEGDVITEFDGKAVNSASELADAAREAKDKNLMKVKLNRDGKSQEVEIKIPKKLKTANL